MRLQFNSVSLNRHLARAYRQNSVGSEGFVEVLAATQTPTDKQWFQVQAGSTILQTITWDLTLLRWYICVGLYTHVCLKKVTELARI
jgi:ADP-glucose pyrophosphorylase